MLIQSRQCRWKEYCSARYKWIKARNNFTVRFRCSRSGQVLYGQIQFFLFVYNLELVFITRLIPTHALCKDAFQLTHYALDKVWHSAVLRVSHESLICVPTSSLLSKCVCIISDSYVMNFPNKLYLDWNFIFVSLYTLSVSPLYSLCAYMYLHVCTQ